MLSEATIKRLQRETPNHDGPHPILKTRLLGQFLQIANALLGGTVIIYGPYMVRLRVRRGIYVTRFYNVVLQPIPRLTRKRRDKLFVIHTTV